MLTKTLDFFKRNKLLFIILIVVLTTIMSTSQYIAEFLKYTTTALHNFELKTFDLRLQVLAQKQDHDPTIVQLLLDDHSTVITAQHPELNLGRIPWPREVWGEVLEFLSRGKPKAVVFDINYLGSEGFTEEKIYSDSYFTQAVKKADTKVFFAILFTDSLYNLKIVGIPDLEDEIKKRVNKIPEDIRIALKKKKIQVLEKIPADWGMKDFISYTIYTPIMKGLLSESYGVGTINLKTDIDGVNREHMPLYKYDGEFYPSLPLAVALSLLPEDKKNLEIYEDKLVLGDREIYLNEFGRNFTTWYGEPKTYQVFHVIDAIVSERDLKAGKTPILDPAIFKDKIVVIGQTASGSDIHHSPMSNVFVGTEIVATNIDNFLNQKTFIKQLNPIFGIILTFLFCCLVWIAVQRSKSLQAMVILAMLIILVYVFITVVALTEFKIWVNLVESVIVLLITLFIAYIVRYFFTHRQLESAIEEATKDGLTKLYNHRFFQEKIHQDLANASRKEDRVSLCLIDIDFFKKFNDTYGHRAGDAVLIQVAQTLEANVRKSDLVARYGGEEMCVLLNNTAVDAAVQVAQKLVDAIAEKVFLIDDGKKKVNVTISIGVATYPIHAKTVPDLIEFADKGLYRAKEGGRNQVGALEDVVDMDESAAGPKQIKEVEIAKAKLLKSIEDFVEISKEKEFDYQDFITAMMKEKELLPDLTETLAKPEEVKVPAKTLQPQTQPEQTKPQEEFPKAPNLAEVQKQVPVPSKPIAEKTTPKISALPQETKPALSKQKEIISNNKQPAPQAKKPEIKPDSAEITKPKIPTPDANAVIKKEPEVKRIIPKPQHPQTETTNVPPGESTSKEAPKKPQPETNQVRQVKQVPAPKPVQNVKPALQKPQTDQPPQKRITPKPSPNPQGTQPKKPAENNPPPSE